MKDEALRQALEALERGETELRWKAITSLRQAIEQAEKREWVGLTDEEIRQIALDTPIGGTNFARAIEAKLKDKNHVS